MRASEQRRWVGRTRRATLRHRIRDRVLRVWILSDWSMDAIQPRDVLARHRRIDGLFEIRQRSPKGGVYLEGPYSRVAALEDVFDLYIVRSAGRSRRKRVWKRCYLCYLCTNLEVIHRPAAPIINSTPCTLRGYNLCWRRMERAGANSRGRPKIANRTARI
jgi:hypothetical protein